MRIRRLKLSGFKSFVEPAELRIEPGLTGVVGPNGCGKSNLLEAIRWVMGENSAKSLRGGGMEDVIFAGTANRPSRDFAEVVLHAEDARGEELEVVRRIERGAGSAYRVNGRDVRAKDVALVFADAATGAHSPALVSQGKIAAVIAAKPAERRQMLEEAAGIAGLHVRRKDAEQKLRATEANLARLEDIMGQLDQQIGSLRRQARQAERYVSLSDRIRLAEARLVYARWRDAAAAADAARAEAQAADARVTQAQAVLQAAQKAQHEGAERLAEARDELADRRDDASAHGHRLAALTTQLEAAEQRLKDLDRQRTRLEEDRGDADRLTRDAAEALARLEKELAEGLAALQRDEARRPTMANALDDADRAARQAELALAQATAAQAGVEAEWRVADAELAAAEQRLQRLLDELARQEGLRAALTREGDPQAALEQAEAGRQQAEAQVAAARTALETQQARKAELQSARDAAGSTLASARAELAGIEREHAALLRDREARARQAKGGHGLTSAIDALRAEPGYERALAAVLGRDAKAGLGAAPSGVEGRFWTGADAPARVSGSLADHVSTCPPELAARLALVHVAEADDGRKLGPGEWLVTRDGALRRWDGFVARGEGAAEAARLEAENRFAALDGELPALRAAVAEAEAAAQSVQAELAELQLGVIASERALAAAADAERTALRALDQAEAAKARLEARRAELAAAADDLAEQKAQAEAELATARSRRSELPDPESGRAQLAAAQAKNDAARQSMQAATAALAAHDQALAVARERTGAQRSDISSWQSRAGDAASRLSQMAQRLDEIEEERAVIAAKPAALLKEIEASDAIRARIAAELAEAEAKVNVASDEAREADAAFAAANETLATAREARAGAAARAENEEERRAEMGRISGERFQCPPPLLPERFEFDSASVAASAEESATMDRLVAERERIGPVNLVAAEELKAAEERHGASLAEQAELSEAVNRLRGSIGNLNREGRERLRAAFEAVNGHFQELFSKLFQGGAAHLALVDSDDPLEAGLEIFAQPPGKRLQSLTLLSGGEQALTAVALIFALFLTNPAPICVLDEVDAPLDDANIERFCDLLEAMVGETDTRYLIVTHNAVTMSRMHRLFGVTMVEKGVSRLVSVDLGGAEELLAAE
ncbi:chromosome segregation SMC family protein [Novosphingobium sp. TH158]|uniref:chromosome segregation SMC family protein n=1 Tax=Novosphingobium sp. TH158 TaxID=2067455 RepID=UPI000C7D2CD7|nr:AAA family ATPase [Novosphingobium sp. TH158]PLK26547.1 chromosome segregation protein [Novosphingobium sp. TH158]